MTTQATQLHAEVSHMYMKDAVGKIIYGVLVNMRTEAIRCACEVLYECFDAGLDKWVVC